MAAKSRRLPSAASCTRVCAYSQFTKRLVELRPTRAAPRHRASTSAPHAPTQSSPPAPGARRTAAARSRVPLISTRAATHEATAAPHRMAGVLFQLTGNEQRQQGAKRQIMGRVRGNEGWTEV